AVVMRAARSRRVIPDWLSACMLRALYRLVGLLAEKLFDFGLVVDFGDHAEMRGSDAAGFVDDIRDWKGLNATIETGDARAADHHRVIDMLRADEGPNEFPAIVV